MGGMRGFGQAAARPRMISPGAGMGMARGGYGMGARPGMNMAGRWLGGSNFGRTGINGFGGRSGMNMAGRSMGASNFGRAGINSFGRAGINSGGLGMAQRLRTGYASTDHQRGPYGCGEPFGRGGVNNRIGSGLTATSLNRANLSNNALNR